MGKVLREATLYRETAQSQKAGVTTLTRGSTVRPAQTNLRRRNIDVLAGHFWVANLPDLTKWNEAYLEINAIATKGRVQVPNPFKLKVDVKDKSFSADIQGSEIVTNVQVVGNGIEFQCRLTELDKINKEKFNLIKNFVDDNDIPGMAQALLNASNLPVNPKEAIKIFFNAVELMDGLNDDDRVWVERPKLDLRSGTNNPLYEGWYAFVSTPKKGPTKLPLKLFESGGFLYESYSSDSVNKPFEAETYLTWQILGS